MSPRDSILADVALDDATRQSISVAGLAGAARHHIGALIWAIDHCRKFPSLEPTSIDAAVAHARTWLAEYDAVFGEIHAEIRAAAEVTP